MKDYGSRTVEVVSFDGYYSGVANDAVGSTRYEVTVRTEGGHSFGNFGNRNAIHQLSRIINDLYGIEVPTRARTTYNVGVIHGGTSVNTIAQDASMLYEYRSEDLGCQEEMRRKFEAIVEKYQADGLEVEVGYGATAPAPERSTGSGSRPSLRKSLRSSAGTPGRSRWSLPPPPTAMFPFRWASMPSALASAWAAAPTPVRSGSISEPAGGLCYGRRVPAEPILIQIESENGVSLHRNAVFCCPGDCQSDKTMI